MRRKIVAGNWKMNCSFDEAMQLADKIDLLQGTTDIEIYLFPCSLFLVPCLQHTEQIQLGAQNAYYEQKGAFTGEVSMWQLKEIGANAVLVGHSERRELFFETNELLKQKVTAAIANELTPFFCCGEPLDVRESGEFFEFVKKQLHDSLFHLTDEEFGKVIIAYEPIWAIGTGLTATIGQAEEMHKQIRSWVEEAYSSKIAQECVILYGGSCNPSNAKDLFACPNVDGGLIGGASLKIEDFKKLVDKSTWITSN